MPPVLAAKGITLDPARHVAVRDGRPLDLGPKELALLELLMAANGRVVSAEELLERAWDEMASPRYRAGEPAPGTSPERFTRMLDAAQYLADHIHEAPVWIVPCMGGANPSRTAGSSIYPAVQNMLLAARALGLGATLTTLYLSFEKEVEAALGLPAEVHSYALLPIGYPMGHFGPVRRVPVDDIVYGDRWGQPYRDQ